MADNIVPTLFGLTPETYQQQRAAQLAAEQQRLASAAAGPGTMLNPSLQPLYAQAAQRGQMLGTALGGIFGMEDPQLKMVRDVTQMRQGFDVSTPDGLRAFSKALSEKGYTDLGLQAAKEADAREKTIQEANLRQAQAKQAEAGKFVQIDLGDRVAIIDPFTKETVREIPKGMKPGEGVAGVAGPVGKSGAWRDADGIVYSASEMQKQRAGFQQGEKLLENLNAITDKDIKNSESWIDWTSGEQRKQVGGKVAKETVAAQAKINAAQLLKQIESLPPGSASNADMIAAKSSFPGYGDAGKLKEWVNDTRTKLQNSLNRQADQYGFKQRVPSTVTPTVPAGAPGSSRDNPIKL